MTCNRIQHAENVKRHFLLAEIETYAKSIGVGNDDLYRIDDMNDFFIPQLKRIMGSIKTLDADIEKIKSARSHLYAAIRVAEEAHYKHRKEYHYVGEEWLQEFDCFVKKAKSSHMRKRSELRRQAWELKTFIEECCLYGASRMPAGKALH